MRWNPGGFGEQADKMGTRIFGQFFCWPLFVCVNSFGTLAQRFSAS